MGIERAGYGIYDGGVVLTSYDCKTSVNNRFITTIRACDVAHRFREGFPGNRSPRRIADRGERDRGVVDVHTCAGVFETAEAGIWITEADQVVVVFVNNIGHFVFGIPLRAGNTFNKAESTPMSGTEYLAKYLGAKYRAEKYLLGNIM